MEGWLKIKPAALRAGVSDRTMRSWLKQGLIHSRLNSGLVLIRTTAIDDFLRQFEVNGNEADQIVKGLLQ